MPGMSPTYTYIAAAFIICLVLFINRIRPRTIPGIPCYPDGHFLLGDLPRMAREAQKLGGGIPFIDVAIKELGPICQLRLGPIDHFVLVNDYAETESLLTRRHATLDRATHTRRVFESILPRGLISLKTDSTWKHHRRIVGPALTSSHLSRTAHNAVDAVTDLIALWTEKSKACGDVFSWVSEQDFENATMDAICGMAFGQSWAVNEYLISQLKAQQPTDIKLGNKGDALFDLQRPDLAKSSLIILNSMPIDNPIPAISHFFTRLSPSYRRSTRLVDEYLKQKIKTARERAQRFGAEIAVDSADNTLDMMVARELRGEDWMSEEDMKQELFLYLVAGTETTAVTLTWWAKFMTNHPDVQRKLRKHIHTQVPEIQDRVPTFEDLTAIKTPYLEAVVQETLRVSRTAGGYTREVTEDMIILGHCIPKGTSIIFSTAQGLEDRSNPVAAIPWGSPAFTNGKDEVHDEDISVQIANSLDSSRTDKTTRKAGFWKAGTGKEFNPDRWIDENGAFDHNAGPNLPFSAGQRGCFGKQLALLELRIFIAQLTLAFFFAPISEEQNGFEAVYNLTTHPKDCYVRPVSWTSTEAQAQRAN